MAVTFTQVTWMLQIRERLVHDNGLRYNPFVVNSLTILQIDVLYDNRSSSSTPGNGKNSDQQTQKNSQDFFGNGDYF